MLNSDLATLPAPGLFLLVSRWGWPSPSLSALWPCHALRHDHNLTLLTVPGKVTRPSSLALLTLQVSTDPVSLLIKVVGAEAGAMAQCLRALATVAGDPGWFSASTYQLTTICNSSSKVYDTLYWGPWIPGTHVIYLIRQTRLHIK